MRNVHHRKCSEVGKYVIEKYINPDYSTLVIAKLNENAGNIDVAELNKYRHKLESILQLPSESSTLVGSKVRCLEIHLVIPHYCYLYAHEVAKNCFLKLQPLNIRYLQIGTYPKIFTTNLTTTIHAKSLLTELSSPNTCKFNSIATV